MKKVLMAGILCLALMAFVSTAFADYEVCGRIVPVKYIKLYASDPADVPTAACELDVTFLYGTQYFDISTVAFGTQINLALLKAWNEQLDISACIIVTSWMPFSAYITEVDFDVLPGPPAP